MDFLTNADQVKIIGNHAKSLVSSEAFHKLNSLLYEPGALTEGAGGMLLDSTTSASIPCESYTPESLAQAIEGTLSRSQQCIFIGDPSEWVVSAAITTYMQAKCLAAVFFIYPVGMAALDSRKELAQVILQLKSNQVPTYLIREPESFFEGIEPNHSWVVTHLKDGISSGSSIEYLCGFPKSSEANTHGR
jgi:hypothetical protein